MAGFEPSQSPKDLKDRHAKTWGTFSVYLTTEDAHLRELESMILRIAAPKGNRQTGKFSRSEDLKRDLKRRVKAAQDSELRKLLGELRDKKKDSL